RARWRRRTGSVGPASVRAARRDLRACACHDLRAADAGDRATAACARDPWHPPDDLLTARRPHARRARRLLPRRGAAGADTARDRFRATVPDVVVAEPEPGLLARARSGKRRASACDRPGAVTPRAPRARTGVEPADVRPARGSDPFPGGHALPGAD